MSDQPKPATGSTSGRLSQWDGSLTPPNPATGEWTKETVLELWQMGGAGCDTNTRMIDIANAHNTANAAERETHKLNLDAVASYIEQNQQLREQLTVLADALHFYRNHDDNGQTATDALRKIGK